MGAAPPASVKRGTMMHAYSLSGTQAGQIATRGRQLLRRGLITHAQHSLLDTVLWAARKPGSATLIASLKTLARMAGQARSTATEGIRRLEELGVLQRIRRRARVAWAAGAMASRVVANAYRLVAPDTETDSRPAKQQPLSISILEAPSSAMKAAQQALAHRRRQMEDALRAHGRAGLSEVTTP
jgi:DNA-binding Lrp family transcriptional regulator